jgi:hypothetical protein
MTASAPARCGLFLTLTDSNMLRVTKRLSLM